jgi:hypothetical protein
MPTDEWAYYSHLSIVTSLGRLARISLMARGWLVCILFAIYYLLVFIHEFADGQLT